MSLPLPEASCCCLGLPELAEGNLTAAEALLSELEGLAVATASLRERLDAARSAAERTECLRDAHDTSVARPQRALTAVRLDRR